jgi:hypothetical protein
MAETHLGTHQFNSLHVCIHCGDTESMIRDYQLPCEPREPARIAPLLSDVPRSHPAYTVIGGPGVVRYFTVTGFFDADLDSALAEIKQSGQHPEIESPGYAYLPEVNLALIDSLFDGSWEERLRLHHALGRLFLNHRMPSAVYCQFHHHLQLGRNLHLDKCLEAWVKGTESNLDLTRSYETSTEHLVLQRCDSYYCVYRKTPFVRDRLNTLAAEAALIAKSAAQEAEAQRDLAACETLAKSRFDTFVYIMEDLRNGTFKIGRSQTPEKRERTLQSEVPEIILRFSIPADQTHEQKLHEHFAAKRLRGEWFALDANDLLWITSFLKANGDLPRVSADLEWLGKLHLSPLRPKAE